MSGFKFNVKFMCGLGYKLRNTPSQKTSLRWGDICWTVNISLEEFFVAKKVVISKSTLGSSSSLISK